MFIENFSITGKNIRVLRQQIPPLPMSLLVEAGILPPPAPNTARCRSKRSDCPGISWCQLVDRIDPAVRLLLLKLPFPAGSLSAYPGTLSSRWLIVEPHYARDLLRHAQCTGLHAVTVRFQLGDLLVIPLFPRFHQTQQALSIIFE